ncbi:stress responsive alpha/beta barrel protein [Rhodococcus wratislaviensis]|uniref:Stress responsive A/B Barrel Domain n=1 Tax=Rhodococcus wratislaviensis TaxID=44752 RepID=A0AB38F6L7_RHOWR|nr:stress responsive alpha/beta barrel protein [Rhodococcus wratislaviensis]SPZ35173.1 Stress responsive A/B Barrel Domain [Rhodococcus wratislaviensis]
MLNHVVTFKWKQDISDEHIQSFHEALSAVSENVPEVVEYRYGRDLALKPGSGDYAISATFEDVPDFRTYLAHPDHVRLVQEFISVMAESYSSVQIEFASR